MLGARTTSSRMYVMWSYFIYELLFDVVFQVVRKEKMLEEEPERLELALRRCKKLTGTLVTLKRYVFCDGFNKCGR